MADEHRKQRPESEWRGGYMATGKFSDLKPPPRGPAPGAKLASAANGSDGNSASNDSKR